jgi:hypothetical protein
MTFDFAGIVTYASQTAEAAYGQLIGLPISFKVDVSVYAFDYNGGPLSLGDASVGVDWGPAGAPDWASLGADLSNGLLDNWELVSIMNYPHPTGSVNNWFSWSRVSGGSWNYWQAYVPEYLCPEPWLTCEAIAAGGTLELTGTHMRQFLYHEESDPTPPIEEEPDPSPPTASTPEPGTFGLMLLVGASAAVVHRRRLRRADRPARDAVVTTSL